MIYCVKLKPANISKRISKASCSGQQTKGPGQANQEK